MQSSLCQSEVKHQKRTHCPKCDLFGMKSSVFRWEVDFQGSFFVCWNTQAWFNYILEVAAEGGVFKMYIHKYIYRERERLYVVNLQLLTFNSSLHNLPSVTQLQRDSVPLRMLPYVVFASTLLITSICTHLFWQMKVFFFYNKDKVFLNGKNHCGVFF